MYPTQAGTYPGAAPPPPPPPPPAEDLPPGWARYVDGTGRAYFHHAATGQTSWQPPARALPAYPPTMQPAPPAYPPHAMQPAPPAYPQQIPQHLQQHQPQNTPWPYAQAPPYAQPGAAPPPPQYAQPSAQPSAPPLAMGYPPQHPPLAQDQSSVPNTYAYNPHAAGTSAQPDAYPPPPSAYSGLSSASSMLAPGIAASSAQAWYPAEAAASFSSSMSMNAALYRGIQLGPGTLFKLEISAKGLKNYRPPGWSDAACWVEMRSYGHWYPLGTTEVVKNARDPHWTARFDVAHHFEVYQEMRFIVRDSGARNGAVIGQVKVPLAELAASPVSNLKLLRNLDETSGASAARAVEDRGTLVVRVHAAELGAGSTRVLLSLSARKLDNKDGLFGKSDPYFVVEQVLASTSRTSSVLARSEVIKNNLNPIWSPVTFKVRADPCIPVKLKIAVYDKDDSSTDDLIGAAYCDLNELQGTNKLILVNESKRQRSPTRYSNSGELVLNGVTVTAIPSFMSYVQGGCRLRFVCAVDFTKSNGDPRRPGSLHYTDGRRPTPYAQALEMVGRTVAPYLSGGSSLEAYGYGGIPSGASTTSFDFPLHPSSADGTVNGVDGLLDAYNQARTVVRLGEPTNLMPVISRTMARSCYPQMPSQSDQHYTILLIITDGLINDLEACVLKIIEASKAHPLSIVIVGVGNGDFSSMKRLDGDKHRLRSLDRSRVASRDIVQFVHWQKEMTSQTVTAQVLSEVPSAVVDYFSEQNIRPNPPPYTG